MTAIGFAAIEISPVRLARGCRTRDGRMVLSANGALNATPLASTLDFALTLELRANFLL